MTEPLKSVIYSNLSQSIQMMIWKYMDTPKHKRDATKLVDRIIQEMMKVRDDTAYAKGIIEGRKQAKREMEEELRGTIEPLLNQYTKFRRKLKNNSHKSYGHVDFKPY